MFKLIINKLKTQKNAAKQQRWRRCSSVHFSVQVGAKALPTGGRFMFF
jgi:hypothetical protein